MDAREAEDRIAVVLDEPLAALVVFLHAMSTVTRESTSPKRSIDPARRAGAVEDDAGGRAGALGGGGADLGDALGVGDPLGPPLAGRGEARR